VLSLVWGRDRTPGVRLPKKGQAVYFACPFYF